MRKKNSVSEPYVYVQPYRYPSPNIPMTAIRRYARQIAQRFSPEMIVLFGSYAYGTPHADSDVDLLVIMPAYDVVNQSIRICRTLDAPFALDLIVRTSKQMEIGWRDDNWFLREIIEKGKILYEAPNGDMDPKGRGRLARRLCFGKPKPTPSRPGVFPLPAGRRKVPKSAPARGRRRRAQDA
jgi:predicted nucleotidyltransferase